MVSKRIIIFLGLPGAGKGTLSDLCVERLGWHQLSTGSLCRRHIADGTEIGKKIDFAIKSGKLVSDSIISEMVFDWLKSSFNSSDTVIFDGFPRTVAQAEMLSNFLNSNFLNSRPSVSVVKLNISEEVVQSRMMCRVICENKKCQATYSSNKSSECASNVDGICDKCGGSLIKRSDDNISSVFNRLKTYAANEENLLKVFRAAGYNMIDLSANVPMDVLFKELEQVLHL